MTPRVLAVALIAVLTGAATIAGGQTPQAGALNYDTFAPEAYRAGMPGLVLPVRMRVIDPQYTPEAMRARLQGVVLIDAVIGVDGSVGEMRISRSLDKTNGLDLSAATTLKSSAFEPGRLNGSPVPVVVTVGFEFRLR